MTYVPGDNPFSIVEKSVFPTEMFFVTAMVNGEQARDLLLHNKEPEPGKKATNRKASPEVVRKYSLLMLSGQFYLNPQPIVLSETDGGEFEVSDLNDGQQRLKALVLASQTRPDIEVPLTFAFNAPEASKWVIDQMKRRLPGDFLRMAGESNANQLSHALRMLYAVLEMQPFQSIPLWRRVELTPQAYTDFLAKHTELKQGLTEARNIATGKRALIMPHVGATLWYLMRQEYGVWKTTEFFNGLASGAELKIGDVRLSLREFLSIQREDKYRWDGFEQLGVLIAACNAWLQGLENWQPKRAFNKLSKTFPKLIVKSKLPKTILTPGNR